MPTFSPQLIDRIQKRFLARHGLAITSTQAEEYLHSFADLFLLFAKLPRGAALQDCGDGLPLTPLGVESKH